MVVGGSGQGVSHTVPGDAKPCPNKAMPSLVASTMALPVQNFPHVRCSHVLCGNGSGSFATVEAAKCS